MITKERMEELDWAWNDSAKWDDDEYEAWYDSLTEEEKNQIDEWDKRYSQGMLRLCSEILKQESTTPLV